MNYEERIKAQIEQYDNVEDMHGQLSSIIDYWKRKHFKPIFEKVTGVKNHIEFYAVPFKRSIDKSNTKRIISLGAGNAAVEIQVVKKLLELGCDNFSFEILELSEHQIKRAHENIEKAGMVKYFIVSQGDFNSWQPNTQYAGVMAHHALHHVMELEHLFQAIKLGLEPQGVFVTFDMIGAKGHARWPEALEFVEKIWAFLPENKKYHHLLRKEFKEFYNHDCSDRGFEGIRAHEILPLLVEFFNFDTFLGYGNLTDEFISRGYGANYDTSNSKDLAFIDFLEFLNSVLLDLGYLKPTKMAAILTKHDVSKTKCYKNLTPEFCIRPPFD
ncbi:trans-aconitate 2-methyltransferase [Aliikangiella sp. G2MR2-5]|uniref:class I SAM-dependent methyltransferase n=1 Tax=Aliikangiella sp. G2MR2-5 TaxID=2788943 RepID=UPI0018A98B08|nr:class I SAM-dependent methyltransferase [Aliikangiella sp. G2MR2-5]